MLLFQTEHIIINRKTYDYSKKKYTKGANTTVLSKSYSAFTL